MALRAATPDGKQLFFSHTDVDDAGVRVNFEIHVADVLPDGGIENSAPVAALSSPAADQNPFVTADGNAIYFASTRGIGAKYRGYRAQRLGPTTLRHRLPYRGSTRTCRPTATPAASS